VCGGGGNYLINNKTMDYTKKTVKWLEKKSGDLEDFFRARLERDELDKFYELLEIERELTLREEQPYD